MLDVLGLGCAAVDDLLYVPAYPPADAKVQVRRRESQCGGLTGNALVAAARLAAPRTQGRTPGDHGLLASLHRSWQPAFSALPRAHDQRRNRLN